MAGLAADERQVAAQQTREAGAGEGEADPEENRFDGRALSRFCGAVKSLAPALCSGPEIPLTIISYRQCSPRSRGRNRADGVEHLVP